jgi:hypothetical protein
LILLPAALAIVGLIVAVWLVWELSAGGFYRNGLFNYRIVWVILGWTVCTLAIEFFLENSN